MRSVGRIFTRAAAAFATSTMLLSLGAASGQPPPIATGPATDVTSTSATLIGYLNPPEPGTAYYFAYGTTTSYDHATAVEPAPPGSGLTEVSATVSGLSPGTTYHYALFLAVAASSTVLNGGDQRFETSASSGGAGGSGSNAGGRLRLVSRTLSVSRGSLALPLWCLSAKPCRGTLSISAAHRRCVAGRAFAVGAGRAKTIRAAVARACQKALGRARRHRLAGRLTAALLSGQPSVSAEVTLVARARAARA